MKNFPAQYTLQSTDVLYFSHIPKTAGMTFRTILEDEFHCDDICPATLHGQLAGYTQDELEKYRLFRGHLSYVDLPKLLVNKHLIHVTVLREPVARVISHYDYIRRMPGDPHYGTVKDMTLEEFAQNLPVGKVGKNVQTYYLAKLLKFDLNGLEPEAVFDLAMASLDQFAFVGILEKFQESLFLLSYIFGWKPILNERRENISGSDKGKSTQHISPTTIELIQQNTLLDQKIYDYARGLFDERFAQMQHDLVSNYAPPNLAVTPISLPLLQSLLERHSEQRYLDLQDLATSVVTYDFRQPLRGRGWHRREYLDPQSAYRWIGPEPTATLDLFLPLDQDLTIEIQAILCTHATAPDVLDSFTLSINNYRVELLTLYTDRNAGIRLFQGIIPKIALQSDRVFTQLTFQVNRVIPLTEINPAISDSRCVGVAINYIKVFPVVAEKQESAALELLKVKDWQETATFVEKYLEPGDSAIAPLAFKLRIPVDMLDVYAGFQNKLTVQWVILYKGMPAPLNVIMPKLILNWFFPVFANGSFVVFAKGKKIPSLSYTLPHVRSLYLAPLKKLIRQTMVHNLKRVLRQRTDQLKTMLMQPFRQHESEI